MKRKVLTVVVVAGLATCAFGQSLILDNASNNGGATATTGGQLYYDPGTGPVLFDGLDYNVGVTVMGGSSAGSLQPMGTYIPSTDPKGYTGFDVGKFQLGPVGQDYAVPGVAAGGLAWIQLQFWVYDGPLASGSFATYQEALAGGDYTGTVLFQNPTSNPLASPPVPATDLVNMPSVIMVVPEPTTIALAGLSIASLLVFRRRK